MKGHSGAIGNTKPAIAYIWPDCSKANGVGRYIHEISKRLHTRFDIHVLAASGGTDFDGSIQMNKIPVHFAMPSYLGVSEFVVRSARLAKKNKYDLVLGQGLPLSGLFDHDIIFAHINSPRFVSWNSHEGDGLRDHIRGFLRLFHPLQLTNRYFRYRDRTCRKIIVPSAVVKRDVTSLYGVSPEKVVIIPLGVDINEFVPKKRGADNEIRKKFHLTPQDHLLFFCAQNFKLKGLSFLLRALHLLDNRRIKLLVGGKGENGGLVEAKEMVARLGLERNVFFVGSVNNIKDYYAASDVFVLPTLYDTFGMVVLEAMASGLPVIVSGKAGVAEIMQDGACGFLLEDPADHQELSEKIATLVRDPDLSTSMGLKAREIAENYSWDVIVERTCTLYDEVLSKKNKKAENKQKIDPIKR